MSWLGHTGFCCQEFNLIGLEHLSGSVMFHCVPAHFNTICPQNQVLSIFRRLRLCRFTAGSRESKSSGVRSFVFEVHLLHLQYALPKDIARPSFVGASSAILTLV